MLGRSGVRLIAGDFNQSPEALEQVSVWIGEGWVECQDLALQLWNQQPVMTCKHSTRRDMIFLSPEAASLCRAVCVFDVFQEHSSVAVDLAVSSTVPSMLRWPMPSEVPWSQVDVGRWQACYQPVPTSASSTEWLSAFGRNFGHSLHGHVQGIPGGRLPKSCYGRGQCLQPLDHPPDPWPARASRPGEEEVRSSFLCKEVQHWFRQLRRIQSLKHALSAAKDTPDAHLYRVQLWRSILAGKGFCHSFAHWWRARPIQLQDSPVCLPPHVPSLAQIALIFHDFRDNYRRLESWHLCRRREVLKHRHEKSRELLFHGLRSAPAGQVDSLTVRRTYTVLEVDAGSCQAMLDPPLDSRGHSTWKLNNEPVAISVIADVTCSFEGAICPEPGDEVEQVQWLASHKDLVEEFLSLWQPRWQKLPSQSDWTRITAFAAAFLPCLDLQLPPISVPQWRRAIQRFKPRAARGPDAFGKQDLLHMPEAAVRELLFLLHSVEQGHCEWPQQWLLGFVCALSKANGRLDANGFRPICLMSMIYRTWSGLRARFLLRKLAVFTQYQAHGFLPGHEAAQVWYYTQALVELACQGDFDLVGMSCDLVKAFNNLPRDPLFQVASLLGVPEALTRPWMQFLAKFERRFLRRRHVGASVLSTCWFP